MYFFIKHVIDIQRMELKAYQNGAVCVVEVEVDWTQADWKSDIYYKAEPIVTHVPTHVDEWAAREC